MSAESAPNRALHCSNCGQRVSQKGLQRCEYVKFIPNGRIERCTKTICLDCSDFGGVCKHSRHRMQLDSYWSGSTNSAQFA